MNKNEEAARKIELYYQEIALAAIEHHKKIDDILKKIEDQRKIADA